MMVKLLVVAAVLGGIGAMLARELPGLKRYQKISSM
jgi:hypothetical protein